MNKNKNNPKIVTDRFEVWSWLWDQEQGATREEIVSALGTEIDVGRRVAELIACGLVLATGERRRSRSGRYCAVLRADKDCPGFST